MRQRRLFFSLWLSVFLIIPGEMRRLRQRLWAFAVSSLRSSVVYGIFAMMEKEKNYILAKISLTAAGILMLAWTLMIIFAL